MVQYLVERQSKKVEERYWDYISRYIKLNKLALPIEKYRRYIR